MKNMSLKKELRKVGAGKHEADLLAEVANSLGGIKPKGLSHEAKKRLAPSEGIDKAPKTWIAWSLGGAFATACLLLIVAQSALPGSWLYPVKRGTEAARTAVQPGYEDRLIEKREDEVEQLMLKKADPAVLEEAKEDYKNTVERSLDQAGPEKTEYQPRYDWSRNWYQRWNDVRQDSRRDWPR